MCCRHVATVERLILSGLSQVFVWLVVLLTTSVVVIVYLFVLPTIVGTYSAPWIVWHLCCGHWLLVMVLFHYYKATTTSPGHPPKVREAGRKTCDRGPYHGAGFMVGRGKWIHVGK